MLRWGRRFLGQNKAGQPRIASTALLLAAFVFLAHSFDTCGAHGGIPNLSGAPQSYTALHIGATCSASPGVACLCAQCACVPIDSPAEDGCSSTSEVSTPAQSIAIQLHAPLILVPLFATEPTALEVSAPPASIFGRDGPQIARLRSQFLFSPLPGRAPPILA